LAIALAHDSGPRRFGLGPVGFGRLSGWTRDHISAAVPVFLKSCARFLNRADVAPLDAVAATSAYVPYVESSVTLPYINASVALGNPVIKGNVYYPVHNSNFRQWAIRHRRGGDFVVYSDRRYVPVVPSITIDL